MNNKSTSCMGTHPVDKLLEQVCCRFVTTCAFYMCNTVFLPANAKANLEAVQCRWITTLVSSFTDSYAGRAHVLLLCINNPSRWITNFLVRPSHDLDKTNSVLSSGGEQSPVACTHMPLNTCWMVPFPYILKRPVCLWHLDSTIGWFSPGTLPPSG
jgi:hypothetical protein